MLGIKSSEGRRREACDSTAAAQCEHSHYPDHGIRTRGVLMVPRAVAGSGGRVHMGVWRHDLQVVECNQSARVNGATRLQE